MEPDEEQALVLLDTWGSGETIDDEPFQGCRYTIRDYCPEFLEVPADLEVISFLSVHVGDKPFEYEGYKVLNSYPAGEHECPYKEHEDHGPSCPLCDGGNYVYWGEEWHVVVVTPETPAAFEGTEEFEDV